MDPRLLEAVHRGDIIKLKELLGENDYPLERSCLHESSETILHISCLAGRTEFVKELLKKKADLATRLSPDGFSPIHIASENGFVEIVRALLTENIELGKLMSSDGRTSLHCAAITGMVAVIKELLMSCPATKDILTSRGETALHLAVRNNQFEAFKAMVDVLKPLNIKELLNLTDEDGNTVLHLATAKKQTLTLKSLLGGQEIDKGTINVNVVNKIGLTALDMLDVSQQMMFDAADYKLRELLQGAGALRAKELGTIVDITNQVAHVSSTISASSPQNVGQLVLNAVEVFNPVKYYRKLAKEVRQTPTQTQNALMVVAVLIAGMAYQAILNPPAGNYTEEHADGTYYYYAIIASGNGSEFIIFMAGNTIGFFASLVVINLLIQGYPLKALLGLAVRCMVANYICGLLLIGPTKVSVTKKALWGVVLVVLVDLIRFSIWLFRRWYKQIRDTYALLGHGASA